MSWHELMTSRKSLLSSTCGEQNELIHAEKRRAFCSERYGKRPGGWTSLPLRACTKIHSTIASCQVIVMCVSSSWPSFTPKSFALFRPGIRSSWRRRLDVKTEIFFPCRSGFSVWEPRHIHSSILNPTESLNRFGFSANEAFDVTKRACYCCRCRPNFLWVFIVLFRSLLHVRTIKTKARAKQQQRLDSLQS